MVAGRTDGNGRPPIVGILQYYIPDNYCTVFHIVHSRDGKNAHESS